MSNTSLTSLLASTAAYFAEGELHLTIVAYTAMATGAYLVFHFFSALAHVKAEMDENEAAVEDDSTLLTPERVWYMAFEAARDRMRGSMPM